VQSALSKLEGVTVKSVKKGSASIVVTEDVTDEEVKKAITGAGFALVEKKPKKKLN